MAGPVVTLEFKGEESGLTSSFDNVGSSSKKMADQVGSSSREMRETGSSFDSLTEKADTAETRFTGFYDTIGGATEGLAAWNDESLSGTDKMIALGQAGADLAGGLVGFVLPALQSVWAKLMETTAAQWLLTTAQTIGTTIMAGLSAAWGVLNTVMAANPILTIIVVIGLLVAAFIWLWNNVDGFRNFFIGAWNGIKSVVGTVVGWVTDRFNGFVGFLKGIGSAIAGIFKGIGDAISGAFKSAVNFVIGILNGAISAINVLISGINLVPGVNIPKIPKIPKMHTGGVVPGTPGSEVLRVLQAGEEVIPASGRGRGGGAAISITGSGGLAELVQHALRIGDIQLIDANGDRIRVA